MRERMRVGHSFKNPDRGGQDMQHYHSCMLQTQEMPMVVLIWDCSLKMSLWHSCHVDGSLRSPFSTMT